MVKLEAQTHVAALSFPVYSHAAPLLSLIRHIATKSPSTYFSFFGVASCNSTILCPYRKAGIPLPPNVKIYDVWDGAPDGYVFTGDSQQIGFFLPVAKDTFFKAMNLASGERGRTITSLITDAFFWFGRVIAEDFGGVPWVPFWTAGVTSLSAHVYTDALRESTKGCKDDDLIRGISGLEKMRVKDLQEGVVAGELNSPFSELLRKMGKELLHADAVLVGSFDELEGQCTKDLKAKCKGFLNIGPLDLILPEMKSEDMNECMEWLDGKEENSVVYISFGTWLNPPANEITSLAEALEERGVPFMWSMREKAMVNLPEGFVARTEGRGKMVTWAPQRKVLSHGAVRLFVTHCGWNSVMEALASGVPVVCRPFYGDQRLNARAMEELWRIGLQVKGGTFTKDGVLECLEKMADSTLWEKMRASARFVRGAAVKATGVGGTSTDNLQVLVKMVTELKTYN